MEISETIKKVIQELIVPELQAIRGEYREIKLTLDSIHKRFDDMSAHFVDQSRSIDETNNKKIDQTIDRMGRANDRIDQLRSELRGEITKSNSRVDQTSDRIDLLRAELHEDISRTNERIDQLRTDLRGEIGRTNERIEQLRAELRDAIGKNTARIDANNVRIDEINKRIDQLSAELKAEIANSNQGIDRTNARLDKTNDFIGRLYEVVVRREEHSLLVHRVAKLEEAVTELKARLVA